MDKLELKLKKLCTYYYDWSSQWFYKFKIDKKENKLFLEYISEYTYKTITIDWLDDISYKISKSRIKENKYKAIFDIEYQKKNQKAKKELEKLAKIRYFKTTFNLK